MNWTHPSGTWTLLDWISYLLLKKDGGNLITRVDISRRVKILVIKQEASAVCRRFELKMVEERCFIKLILGGWGEGGSLYKLIIAGNARVRHRQTDRHLEINLEIVYSRGCRDNSWQSRGGTKAGARSWSPSLICQNLTRLTTAIVANNLLFGFGHNPTGLTPKDQPKYRESIAGRRVKMNTCSPPPHRRRTRAPFAFIYLHFTWSGRDWAAIQAFAHSTLEWTRPQLAVPDRRVPGAREPYNTPVVPIDQHVPAGIFKFPNSCTSLQRTDPPPLSLPTDSLPPNSLVISPNTDIAGSNLRFANRIISE